MIESAILIANLVVTAIVFLVGSAITYMAYQDRGLDFDFEQVTLLTIFAFLLPLCAFAYPAAQILHRITSGN